MLGMLSGKVSAVNRLDAAVCAAADWAHAQVAGLAAKQADSTRAPGPWQDAPAASTALRASALAAVTGGLSSGPYEDLAE